MTENRLRRRGRPASSVNTSEAGRILGSGLRVVSRISTGTAGNAAKCAAKASTTTWGSGTVRYDDGVFGGARYGALAGIVTSCWRISSDRQEVNGVDLHAKAPPWRDRSRG